MQKWKELPGFRTFRDFFAGLFQGYDNIAPEPGLKRKLIDGIQEIEFIGEKRKDTPGKHFYKYVYSTTGSQARYWLEQRPRR